MIRESAERALREKPLWAVGDRAIDLLELAQFFSGIWCVICKSVASTISDFTFSAVSFFDLESRVFLRDFTI